MKELARILGPLLIVIGVIFLIIGMVSFFSAFGSFGMPKYFWCAFVGIPMIGIGSFMTKFAYLKPISNYVADETKESIGTVAGTVAKEVGKHINFGSGQPTETERVRCHKCNHPNDLDSKFCSNCGSGLLKSVSCPSCGELNDPDAKFCDNCGKQLV